MSRKLPKIELKLLKKLVSELEAAMVAAQERPTEKEEEVHNFITEMSKVSGLAAGVAQEAGALVKDCYQVSRIAQQPATDLLGMDSLVDLLGGSGGSGSDKDRN